MAPTTKADTVRVDSTSITIHKDIINLVLYTLRGNRPRQAILEQVLLSASIFALSGSVSLRPPDAKQREEAEGSTETKEKIFRTWTATRGVLKIMMLNGHKLAVRPSDPDTVGDSGSDAEGKGGQSVRATATQDGGKCDDSVTDENEANANYHDVLIPSVLLVFCLCVLVQSRPSPFFLTRAAINQYVSLHILHTTCHRRADDSLLLQTNC